MLLYCRETRLIAEQFIFVSLYEKEFIFISTWKIGKMYLNSNKAVN